MVFKMKLDVYFHTLPTNPRVWSRTPFEIISTLEQMGMLNNAHGALPYKLPIPFSNFLFPILKLREKRALQIYNRTNPPDAILSIHDIAVFPQEFFVFHDIDALTIMKHKLPRRAEHWNKMPLRLLEYRHKRQKLIFNKATGILLASNWVARSVRTYIDDKSKVHVVGLGHRYTPISLNKELVERRFENPNILFVGKNARIKGIDTLVRAFVSLLDYMDARLIIVTDPRTIPRETLRIMREYQDHIILSGLVQPTHLEKIYKRSSIFVMPSKFEAWGKVFFEAMSFGLPVIGRDCCAMPEFIHEGYNGYLISYSEEDSHILAERIVDVFNRYKKYQKLSKNAIKIGEYYTWENVVKRIMNIIKKACRGD